MNVPAAFVAMAALGRQETSLEASAYLIGIEPQSLTGRLLITPSYVRVCVGGVAIGITLQQAVGHLGICNQGVAGIDGYPARMREQVDTWRP